MTIMMKFSTLSKLLSAYLVIVLFRVTVADESNINGVTSAVEHFSHIFRQYPIDIVFVLDKSASIQHQGWQTVISIVYSILEHFTVSSNNTQIAVISYGSYVSVDVNSLYTPTHNKCSLMTILRKKLESIETYGYTATYAALMQAYSVLLKSRPNAKKVVFLVTDGKSNIGVPPVRASIQLRSLRWNKSWNTANLGPQIEIYSFGVGDAFLTELKSVAYPSTNHTYLLANMSELGEIARRLHKDRQKETLEVIEGHVLCGLKCDRNAACTCATRVAQYVCVCLAGYQGDGFTCEACPIGTYKSDISPNLCQPCTLGHTTASVAASNESQCVCDKEHTSSNGTCIKNVCPPLPAIEHGKQFHVYGEVYDEVRDTGLPCTYNAGDSCHYSCLAGYRLTALPAMVCRANGTWHGTIPTCRIVDCKTLRHHGEDDPHLTIKYLNDTYPTTYGSVVLINCDPGWTLLGDQQRHCTRTGRWSPTRSKCIESFCTVLKEKDGGEFSPLMCQKQKSRVGTVCLLSCYHGYHLVGDGIIRCTLLGVWNVSQNYSACVDIEPPQILCPRDLDIRATSSKGALVYWNTHQAFVSDNSGKYRLSIVGNLNANPAQVAIGHHQIHYIAVDDAGNQASCVRNIRILDNIKMVDCPDAMTLHDVLGEGRNISWPGPVFWYDDLVMPTVCTRINGSFFQIGSHTVMCHPKNRYDISCTFSVILIAKRCIVPPPPLHGSVFCLPNTLKYLQVCDVSCFHKYDFSFKPQSPYLCDNHANWINGNGPHVWPDCSERRIVDRAKMQVRLEYHYYNQPCEIIKTEIKNRFRSKIKKWMKWYCTDTVRCHLELSTITVSCGDGGRRKRQTMLDTNYGLEIVRNEEILPHTVTSSQKLQLDGKTPDHARNIRAQHDNVSSHNLNKDILRSDQLKGEASNHRGKRDSQKEQINSTVSTKLLKNDKNHVNDFIDPQVLYVAIDVDFYIREVPDDVSKVPEIFETAKVVLHRTIVSEDDFQLEINNVTVSMNRSDMGELHYHCGRYQVLKSDPDRVWTMFCLECPPGTFTLGRIMNNSCELCPRNFVSVDTVGYGRSCKPCPNGTYTHYKGARDFTECQPLCAPNTWSATGISPCSQCPTGYYQNMTGQTSCFHCPEEVTTIEDVEFTPSCGGLCPAGSYKLTSASICILCHMNTYQPLRGADHCHICPEHTGILRRGAQNSSECTDICSPSSSRCQNNGTCLVNPISGYRCQCIAGFAGLHCEINVDDCDSSPCHNNGSCMDQVADFTCHCDPRYTGRVCDIKIDYCDSSPCHPTSWCVDLPDMYQCYCRHGYTGQHCDTMINQCDSDPCYQGRCEASLDSYTCHCLPGYDGVNCTVQLPLCASRPCVNGGTCSEDNGFTCTCPFGYTGLRCETALDHCSSKPCFNTGRCFSSPAGYRCRCQPPYYGNICQYKASPEFDLVFQHGKLSDYAIVSDIPDLSALTISVWIRTRDVTHFGTILSYSTHRGVHLKQDLALTDYGNLQLIVTTEFALMNTSVATGHWTHVCITWAALDGDWMLFINGTMSRRGRGLSRNKSIVGGGQLIVGQGHDTESGSFNPRESFIGELSQLNIYSSPLNYSTIQKLANHTRCDMSYGDIVAWTDILNNINGNIIRNFSLCLDTRTCPHESCDMPRMNQCEVSSCENGATCQPSNVGDGYFCLCPPHLTGNRCDVVINQCMSQPCHNNGTCIGNSTAFTCTCPTPESMDDLCHYIHGPCASNPCQKRGICTENILTGYNCSCLQGYQGDTCSGTQDVCAVNPCQNQGTCVRSRDTLSGYECRCSTNWVGDVCDIYYSPNCEINPCMNNGTCVELFNSTGFTCDCSTVDANMTDGAMLDEFCAEISPCVSNVCRNAGLCVYDINGTYDCICPVGYKGRHCDVITKPTNADDGYESVTPITHHTYSSGQPTNVTHANSTVNHCVGVWCHNGGKCVEAKNTFECVCQADYSGIYCQQIRPQETKRYYGTLLLVTRDAVMKPNDVRLAPHITAQIYQLYSSVIADARLDVTLSRIIPGDKYTTIEYVLTLTVYTDSPFIPDFYDMQKVMMDAVSSGHLGLYSTLREGFTFSLHMPTVSKSSGLSNVTLTIIICCASIVGIVVVVSGLTCLSANKYCHHKKLAPQESIQLRNNLGMWQETDMLHPTAGPDCDDNQSDENGYEYIGSSFGKLDLSRHQNTPDCNIVSTGTKIPNSACNVPQICVKADVVAVRESSDDGYLRAVTQFTNNISKDTQRKSVGNKNYELADTMCSHMSLPGASNDNKKLTEGTCKGSFDVISHRKGEGRNTNAADNIFHYKNSEAKNNKMKMAQLKYVTLPPQRLSEGSKASMRRNMVENSMYRGDLNDVDNETIAPDDLRKVKNDGTALCVKNPSTLPRMAEDMKDRDVPRVGGEERVPEAMSSLPWKIVRFQNDANKARRDFGKTNSEPVTIDEPKILATHKQRVWKKPRIERGQSALCGVAGLGQRELPPLPTDETA